MEYCYFCHEVISEEVSDVAVDSSLRSCHPDCVKSFLGESLTEAQEKATAANALLSTERAFSLILGSWSHLGEFENTEDCPICSVFVKDEDPHPHLAAVDWVSEKDGREIQIAGVSCEICGFMLPYPPSTLYPYTLEELHHLVEE